MDSKTYWEQREAANLVSNLKTEKEYERELERIYDDMLDGVQKEIESFYARYANENGITIADARKAVSQLDIEAYERKAKRYVKDKDFSKIANEEMRLYNLTMKINRLEMLKANIGLELLKGHAELEKFMGDILQGRTEEELRRQAGILGKTIKNNAKLANSIVNASYHNATFSQRVWMYHGQMRAELGMLLENGLIQGKNARQLTKELRKYYKGTPTLKNGRDGAEFAAERLMRTELARVQTDAQKRSFEKNGFGKYKFIVNSGCCAKCKAVAEKNDGVYDVADMMPGTNAPPMHPFCRCSTAAYEDSDEYEAWLDYLDKGNATTDWNKFKLKISSPGSTKSFKRSLNDIRNKKAGLDKRRSNLLKRLPNTGDYVRLEKNTISTRDLAYLSAATNCEFALFRSKTGDVLVRGNAQKCDISGDLGEEILNKRYEWVAHSHVDGGKLAASADDRETLRKLGQKSSVIIGIDGDEQEFFASLF